MLNVLICIDGLGADTWLDAEMPNLRRMGKGREFLVDAVMPTVTNVNNVSILTQSFRRDHDIVSNFFYDEWSGAGVYMEEPGFIRAPTVFQACAARNDRSVFLSAKEKLIQLCGTGATIAFSVENQPAWIVAEIGPPPSIYSVEANWWIFDAASAVLKLYPKINFVYISTTDYVMHLFEPTDDRFQAHLSGIDSRIVRIADNSNGRLRMAVTADHGMNAKTRAVDLTQILASAGICAQAIPIIQDKHEVHHQNLAAATYIYLEKKTQIAEAISAVSAVTGVERILTREDGSVSFNLCPDRIGNLMVLGDKDTAFGRLSTQQAEVTVRSHGSCHERKVPLITFGCKPSRPNPLFNKDAISSMGDDRFEYSFS